MIKNDINAIFNTPYMLLGKRILNHQYTCFICFIFCFNHDLKMSLTYLSFKKYNVASLLLLAI